MDNFVKVYDSLKACKSSSHLIDLELTDDQIDYLFKNVACRNGGLLSSAFDFLFEHIIKHNKLELFKKYRVEKLDTYPDRGVYFCQFYNKACYLGSLDIVKYIYNDYECYDYLRPASGIESAINGDQLEVVKFLVPQSTVFVKSYVEHAKERKREEIVKYLESLQEPKEENNFTDFCKRNAIINNIPKLYKLGNKYINEDFFDNFVIIFVGSVYYTSGKYLKYINDTTSNDFYDCTLDDVQEIIKKIVGEENIQYKYVCNENFIVHCDNFMKYVKFFSQQVIELLNGKQWNISKHMYNELHKPLFIFKDNLLRYKSDTYDITFTANGVKYILDKKCYTYTTICNDIIKCQYENDIKK